MNSRAISTEMAFAGNIVIVEAEEWVEVGELGPSEIDVPAPLVDMIYVREGNTRYVCPYWQRLKQKAQEGGK